ncbi:hypothetical protein [Nocardioides pyridinolyticus]
MSHVVSVLVVSAWDKAAALGTIAGAVATLGAVIGALWLGKRDRDAADAAVQEQLLAAKTRSQRECRLDLLLALMREVGNWIGAAPETGDRLAAEANLAGLLQALGPVDYQAMPAVRALVGSRFPLEGPNYEDIYVARPETVASSVVVGYAQREISSAIQETTL